MPEITLEQLRRYAIGRSLFAPTSLMRAIAKLGFVQADPIRAPARAQDLTLRLRVKNYRAGDLERAYPRLALEEDFFINYGFLPRAVDQRMHPRPGRGIWEPGRGIWDATRRRRAKALLAFVNERGSVHPREVDAEFSHGSVQNYWGGSSNATTRLLDAMHYRGFLRVVRREGGVRIYGAREVPEAVRDAKLKAERLDALVDLVVQTYAPLPAASIAPVIGRLRYAAPQWAPQLKAAIARAKQRLAHAKVAGHEWYWPAEEKVDARWDGGREELRLLTPFDPIVWDRRRFQIFWGWAYRFEAYTPVVKRKLGYYALPVLWRDEIAAWANVGLREGKLDCQVGFVGERTRDAAFARELEREVERMRVFLGG
jgi:uncharacterized protein YcaQ